MQLFHGGREQVAERAASGPRLAPSAVPSQRFRVEPRALRGAEIDELVAGYARGAELAAAGGLDGVEVSAAHRYLIEQFSDPALNRRADEWADGERFLARGAACGPGGRARARARRAPLGGARRGAERSRQVAVAERVDYLSLALGESSTYLGSTWIVPPPPVAENAVARACGALQARRAADRQRRASSTPAAADRLVADGVADAWG